MALMDNTRQSNGAKKTRQGNSNNTKFGTKPLTHLGSVPKKTLNKYKKRKQMLGTLFNIFQIIIGIITFLVLLLAIYVLLFDMEHYK